MIWRVCFAAALFLCAAVIAAVIISWRRGHASSKVRFSVAAAGAFAVTFTLLLPCFWDDGLPALSRVILVLHATAQAFTLDIPIGDILGNLSASHPDAFFAVYSRMVAVFAILCPLFTVGFLLSLVKNFWSVLRLTVCFRSHAYVFSELNEMSLAFARGVAEGEKGIAVFADVGNDTDPALTEQAERLRAICFSKSIEDLPIRRTGKRGVHFLLMEENESNALAASLALTKKYRDRPNTQIVLFSSSATAVNVIDSVENTSPLPGRELVERIKKNIDTIWDADTWKESGALAQTNGFLLRRIDPIRELARNTLLDTELIKHLKEQSAGSKVISLMIVGAGRLGKELMKTAAWLYQTEGYKVEINLFDRRRNSEVRKQLEQECPELLDRNLGKGDGDASYEINIFPCTDCFSSSFDKKLSSEQLRRTQAVFVSLGDDDLNVRAAIRLRELFDRQFGKPPKEDSPQGKKALKEAQPWIYAVIYNDEKLAYLALQPDETAPKKNDDARGDANAFKKRGGLQNCKEEYYEIRLIGSLSSQFRPQTLEAVEAREQSAIARHLSWMVSDHYVKQAYETDPDFQRNFTALCAAHGIREEEIKFFDVFEGDFEQTLEKQVKMYYAYEYYRDSSVATQLHKEIFLPQFTGKKPETIAERKKLLTSFGKDACSRRLTEHCRWNAYMRSIGFRRGERFDRGLLHSDLIPFGELKPTEQFKD